MSRVNVVQTINNNSSIEIPFTTNNSIKNNTINLNTASIDELMMLKGIGKAKAEKIIAYRNNHPFVSIEEIMNVSGIGEDIFTGIKDNIIV
jgi:competence protein ComEA